MSYFFTADLHLWHRRIMELAGRPYASVEEHNAAIQDNINQDVGPRDTLVILGDVAFGPWKRLAKWFDDLRCKNVCIVLGNHDDTVERLNRQEPGRFKRFGDVIQFKIPMPGQEDHLRVFCSHYAHRVWNKSHRGSLHLYGHSHGTLPDGGTRSMDVGVDTHKYRPWSLDEIVAQIGSRPCRAVDQHQPELRKLPGNTLCALCGIKLCYHEEKTLACPESGTSGVAICYHKTQFFAPKRPEGWLREVLDDAKRAHDQLPDWAK